MTGILFGGWVGTVIACIGVVFISAVAMRAWYRMDKLEKEVRVKGERTMKQPRKLKRAEKIAVAASGRDPKAYAVEKVESGLLYLIHKQTGKREFVAM